MDETRVFNPLDLQLSRSVYDWSVHSMGTCLVGRLIPAYTFNVLPGSEFTMRLDSLFKMATPVYPTMDYLYADIAFFFVPYKTIMSRRYASPTTNDASQSWEGFIGAQDFAINMPIPSSGVLLPRIVASSGGFAPGCLGNYLYGQDGVNNSTYDIYVNALPLLSYFAIWNENYREPNLQTCVTWSYGSSGGRPFVYAESTPNICIADCEVSSFRSGGTAGSYEYALSTSNAHILNDCAPLPTSVFHGYFGSCLPWPQRNLTGVALPVGGFAPLKVGSSMVALGGTPVIGPTNRVGDLSNSDTDGVAASSAIATIGINPGGSVSVYGTKPTSESNLGVDLSNATAVDVEMLRALITKQHWFEDLARSGNRIDELEYGTFGVRPKDSGLDRPMYLGGKRIQLNVEMVASTNGGTTTGAAAGAGSLGDLGAFSHTNDKDFFFHHGFDTWGAVQCVFTIRTHNLIASGIDRHWLKETREDWYWPEFANLGNQSILKKEIQSVTPAQGFGQAVLGYQEYGEEWRTPRDMVTGLLVPGRSLGFMTYAHYYNGTNGATTLAQVLDASKQWIDVDRTLSVQQSASGFQFIYQFTFGVNARIPVGKYSFPGVSRI